MVLFSDSNKVTITTGMKKLKRGEAGMCFPSCFIYPVNNTSFSYKPKVEMEGGNRLAWVSATYQQKEWEVVEMCDRS